MTQCAKIIVGLVAHFRNIFIKRYTKVLKNLIICICNFTDVFFFKGIDPFRIAHVRENLLHVKSAVWPGYVSSTFRCINRFVSQTSTICRGPVLAAGVRFPTRGPWQSVPVTPL